ncbi:hypothetical protein LJC07_06790 [Christensenellaceae bacterium OttesenSCG-928-L17]|nr:hypothetical protein [Christensenellaceae bacterium OttesenSCG-928-L17]
MQYGHFDEKNREYVIDKIDLPVSWTNYIGTKDMCGVFNHTAGGYLFYKSPEYHRITRFRPNGVPMDGPGHYIYLRDDADGDYWSVSYQPVCKPLNEANYICRHGMSYSVYECTYRDIHATQKLFIAEDDPVEIIDVTLHNVGNTPRTLSVFSYLEFSFHLIDMDNRNFQMSLYAAGSRYEDGVIEHELHYEENGFQFFTSSFEPDSFDCLRDSFIGAYRTERNPLGVENGELFGRFEQGGNHCGALHKRITLQPGETVRFFYLLGEGNAQEGKRIKKKYANAAAVDRQDDKRLVFWEEKFSRLQVKTPSEGMNTLLNTWTLYQSEINVMFSRFSSFIEVGGRTGLGYRDTAQDAMCIPHSNPEKCRSRLIELLRALTSTGYGLHLFEPVWFDPNRKEPAFRSPTVVPTPNKADIVHGIEDACSDDALWLVGAVAQYVKETGEFAFLDEIVTYADEGEGSVYEHLLRILDFSIAQVGANGICKGLRADWNDCLNLGGGESAMVSFLLYWAIVQFVELARFLGRDADATTYETIGAQVQKTAEQVLYDGDWYIRGITADGRKIGTKEDTEGRVHLESNAWAVLSGVASQAHGEAAMQAVDDYLYTDYGIMLNAPPYKTIDDGIGFITRVYPGLKENGAIFSHPNPWAWAAQCVLGNGDRAMEYYEALSPYRQNDCIEVRQSEPYTYCQFVVGKAHTAFGRARHPFMTGTAGWAYFSATQYMLGVCPGLDELIINPCLPASWRGFQMRRSWRGANYHIRVFNPNGVQKGVRELRLNGRRVDKIPVCPVGSNNEIEVVMG